MGKFFVMSHHFNKSSASDFGLIPKDDGTAVDPRDDSVWTKAPLYDFGWGKENGYFKAPLPDFDTLFGILHKSDDKEDVYGAASVVLEKYPDRLLSRCESIITDPSGKEAFKRLVCLFDLKYPLNRSNVIGKTCSQIQNDFERWQRISEVANKI